jgi:hypothetical protein
MTDASAPKQKRIDLLRKAIEHHSKALMADATNGATFIKPSKHCTPNTLT